MRFLPFKHEVFSSAISLDTSFGYLPSEVEDIQSLTELKKTLTEGGVFNIDVFNRDRLMLKYRKKRLIDFRWILLPNLLKPNRFARIILSRFFSWKEYPSFFLSQKRLIDSDGKHLHDLWLIRDKIDGQIRVFKHEVRLYEKNRLRILIENAGFTISEIYGDYNGQWLSQNSNRLIFIAYSS